MKYKSQGKHFVSGKYIICIVSVVFWTLKCNFPTASLVKIGSPWYLMMPRWTTDNVRVRHTYSCLPWWPISAVCVESYLISPTMLMLDSLIWFFMRNGDKQNTRGPIYYHWFNLVHYTVWDEISYLFPNFNGTTVKFGNEYVISSNTLLGKWLLTYAWI